ncbi:MAG: LAGLIDADG family homing endonuclease, partial [archaeon]|nr:LAGLIDADG family homing endonuclease [archaeon]
MEEEITKILKRAHKIKKVFVPKELRKKYNLKVRMLFNDLIDKPGLLLKCKRHNISTFTIAEELQLVKRYLQGESTLDLSKDGLSHSAIANTINKYANTRIRSKSFSLMHLKKYEIRKKQYHLQSNYAKYLLKNKIIEFGEQESGVALISAFILTDGYVSKSKSKKRLVLGFSNTNKELVQAFTDLIFMTFGEVPSCIKLNIKQKSSRYVAPWHNHLIKKVLNFCFDKNNKTAKKILKIKNHKLLRECLRIAYSCDGFISFYVAIEKYGYSTKYYSRLRPNLAIG